MSEGGRKGEEGGGQRRKKSLMRPGCSAFSSIFAHSTNSHPFLFIWPNLPFQSFLPLFLEPLFLSCISSFSLFPIPLTSNATHKLHLANQLKKTPIPILVTEQTQLVLCWLNQVPFQNNSFAISSLGRKAAMEMAENSNFMCLKFQVCP